MRFSCTTHINKKQVSLSLHYFQLMSSTFISPWGKKQKADNETTNGLSILYSYTQTNRKHFCYKYMYEATKQHKDAL